MADGGSSNVDVLVVALGAERAHVGPHPGGLKPGRSGIWPEFHDSIGNSAVIVVESGVGMIASEAATEHAIAMYSPTYVPNFGSAGSHECDILPGDVVIANRAIAYNTMQVLATGEELFVGRRFSVAGENIQRGGCGIECDASLVTLTQRCADSWLPEPWMDRALLGQPLNRQPTIRTGPVISADMWIQCPARIDVLHRRHQSLAPDMETVAIAQVAAMHDVPFLSIMDISNNELYASTSIHMGEIVVSIEGIGKRSAVLMAKLLHALAAQEE